MPQQPLDALREEIDQLDNKIVHLLNERAAIAHRVGAAKKDGVVYRPAREAAVLTNVAKASSGDLPPESLAVIYKEIIAACRNLQQPLKVAYLGPEGTYCEQAARRQCGGSSTYLPAATLDEVVAMTEKGDADIAILPVENSTEGSVTRTLDLLMKTSLRVCGEVVLPVRHQLLSTAASLDDIDEVLAHPQALAQCRQWLDTYLPRATRTATASNAAAAQIATNKPRAAAIAGVQAADLYQLAILSKNIQDTVNNTTRFIVLGLSDTIPTGHDKTSLVCATANTPGALNQVLTTLAAHDINLVKLESRPSPNVLWDYLFYIDIDGHEADSRIVAALDQLREQTTFIKRLGSYPKEG